MVLEKKAPKKRKGLAVIDCDVHEMLPSLEDLFPYLDEPWKGYIKTGGWAPPRPPYAWPTPGGTYMEEAKLKNGAPPGSDYEVMCKQLLDKYNVKYAMLTGLFLPSDQNSQPQFKNALASAYNDWLIQNWIDKDDRFRMSIHINCHDPIAAAKEIDRLGKHPKTVQVMISVIPENFGSPFYDPIYEAIVRNNLKLSFHISTVSQTVLGYPTYFMEWYSMRAQNYQSIMVTMITGGVFERFPELKVMMIEGGFSWVVPFVWRMDLAYRTFRREVPWVKKNPSEYVKKHFRFTTQPMDDPEPKLMKQMIEMLGPDTLCFASDYAHWDFDDPYRAIATTIPKEWRQKILFDNANEFYGFE